ncbi:NIPA-like protein [Lachnellula subtilissima]|uniref:NIPA-like protein n=1 Tax=Lachnellula subtilissima TaxID=602034 RepID=A0A8H8RNK6_9HELO|nr:NIPA-like protein [Lachnellula subtilissima]
MYLASETLDATNSIFTAPPLTRAPALLVLDRIVALGNGDSQLQRWSSLIGIVTAIVGNILISFALNIQRYAHIRLHQERSQAREKAKAAMRNAKGGGYGTVETAGHLENDVENEQDGGGEDDPLRRSFQSMDSQSTTCSQHESSYLQSPYWWGGIILMTVGEAGNFLAYGFAPASIVSPLGVVALISNCVIAPIMLKEPFRLRDFWGVVIAVGGAVTVVLSAKTQEKKLGPHEILGAITTTAFEIYMGVTIFLIGVLLWASPRYGNKTILVDLGLVGLFGGYTALSTKGVASMLSYTLWRALTTPVTYILVVVLVGTAIMQVRYVNKALQRFDSTQVIPVQFVMFTLSVIIGSAILYRDFEKMTRENVGKFIGGCLLTFFGVFLITSGRERHDDEEDEESEEEAEERIRLADQEPSWEETMGQDGDRRFDSTRRTQNAPPASRRSSKISFADTLSRPRTPHMQSNTSYLSARVPPSIMSSDGAEETPLLNNAWIPSSDDLLTPRHPGMISSSSSPMLPSEAQISPAELLKPAAPDRSSSQGNVHTHPNLQQSPAPPPADRPMTPAARHSIARMMPGPLLSPLSGGLSVVVADSLRRGVESQGGKKFRRGRLNLRRSKSTTQGLLTQSADVSHEELETSPLKHVSTNEQVSKSLGTESGTEWSRLTRARSLSNTLGDLFRGKRQRLENHDGGGDEEAGPSGS